MGYSLLQLGADTRKQALAGLESSAKREEQRDRANENLKAAERTKTMSSIGTGAGIGFAVGGPMGAAIGAGAGLILGELF